MVEPEHRRYSYMDFKFLDSSAKRLGLQNLAAASSV
jgi:hypothetical protein